MLSRLYYYWALPKRTVRLYNAHIQTVNVDKRRNRIALWTHGPTLLTHLYWKTKIQCIISHLMSLNIGDKSYSYRNQNQQTVVALAHLYIQHEQTSWTASWGSQASVVEAIKTYRNYMSSGTQLRCLSDTYIPISSVEYLYTYCIPTLAWIDSLQSTAPNSIKAS